MTAKRKVLVVDNYQTNLMLYQELLEDNYELETAENGEMALQMFCDFEPDIVLLDIMTPGIFSYKVCEEIRKTPGVGLSTKIILVSVKIGTTDRLIGYEAGADDYLIRPFDQGELEAKLKLFLKLKSMEEIDRLKRSLMSLFSHETRTPLNGILGPLQLLLSSNDENTAEDRLNWLNMMADSAYRLQILVDEVLLLSNLRSGNRLLNRETVVSSEILNYVLYNVQILTASKDINIHMDIEEGTALSVDKDLILQCLVTIVSNALHFSHRGSTIELSGAVRESDYVISVKGGSEGVDVEVHKELINRFAKVNEAEHLSGQILSLSIAYEVAKLHSGKIEANLTPEEGTTLTVSLPLAA